MHMRIHIIIGLAALMLLPNLAEAKLTKYWVLKMSISGGSADYHVFTSPVICQAAMRQWLANMKTLQNKFKNEKDMHLNADAKCLNHIPYGYAVVR